MWLSGLEMAFDTPREVVVTAARQRDAMPAIRVIQRHYLPHTLILFKAGAIEEVAPFTVDMDAGDGVTFYVCTGQRCQSPTTDLGAVLDALDPLGRDDAVS